MALKTSALKGRGSAKKAGSIRGGGKGGTSTRSASAKKSTNGRKRTTGKAASAAKKPAAKKAAPKKTGANSAGDSEFVVFELVDGDTGTFASRGVFKVSGLRKSEKAVDAYLDTLEDEDLSENPFVGFATPERFTEIQTVGEEPQPAKRIRS